MSNSETKLDFGCGPFKKPGYVGLDICPFEGVDILYDGRTIPLPDNSVDEIYSSHCLEHVADLPATLAELWRISKPDAVWTINVPHFSSSAYWYSCDHKRPFGVQSFDGFNLALASPDTRFIRMGINLRTVALRFSWWWECRLEEKRKFKFAILTVANRIFNTPANAAPFFCDRIWCRWVGGFDVIQFTLRVTKP